MITTSWGRLPFGPGAQPAPLLNSSQASIKQSVLLQQQQQQQQQQPQISRDQLLAQQFQLYQQMQQQQQNMFPQNLNLLR
jgi:hypothetical protein